MELGHYSDEPLLSTMKQALGLPKHRKNLTVLTSCKHWSWVPAHLTFPLDGRALATFTLRQETLWRGTLAPAGSTQLRSRYSGSRVAPLPKGRPNPESGVGTPWNRCGLSPPSHSLPQFSSGGRRWRRQRKPKVWNREKCTPELRPWAPVHRAPTPHPPSLSPLGTNSLQIPQLQRETRNARWERAPKGAGGTARRDSGAHAPSPALGLQARAGAARDGPLGSASLPPRRGREDEERPPPPHPLPGRARAALGPPLAGRGGRSAAPRAASSAFEPPSQRQSPPHNAPRRAAFEKAARLVQDGGARPVA
ncbi:hypothetical protein J0S82_012050 [Galemys pyrenaicus]|uniref:Uncharacterized protein n=1 Tax=Galemys pyrenaicus TaxID=202257 RepID=A0A8J6DML7_GALPY|nr:hypothetical protein J0S82_012050 [Galemys pyrenaicus]